MLLIVAWGDCLVYTSPIISPSTHVFKQLFFFCVSTPTVLLLNVDYFLISPFILLWILALLLVEKSIMFDYTTLYQSLYTTFSWFCSFHSASIPGGHSNSCGISPVRYSFEHNSIPSPTYTTICSAIPQLKDIPSFSNSLPPQRMQL